jgi:hypothetical protein
VLDARVAAIATVSLDAAIGDEGTTLVTLVADEAASDPSAKPSRTRRGVSATPSAGLRLASVTS